MTVDNLCFPQMKVDSGVLKWWVVIETELFTIFQQREKKFYRYLYGNGEGNAGGTKCCQLDNFLINFNLSLHVLLPFFIL